MQSHNNRITHRLQWPTHYGNFCLSKFVRGSTGDASVLPSLQEIGAYTLERLWRSVQQDQSLMTALKRKCTANRVALSSAFAVDDSLFLDMQK